MRYLLVGIMLAGLLAVSFAQVTTPQYTRQSANATITNATLYLEEVNASGYIFFYPNMKTAYMYLSKANAALNTSPEAAVLYADEAQASAKSQYASLNRFREISLAGSVAFTIAMCLLLYWYMTPRKAAPAPMQRRKG